VVVIGVSFLERLRARHHFKRSNRTPCGHRASGIRCTSRVDRVQAHAVPAAMSDGGRLQRCGSNQALGLVSDEMIMAADLHRDGRGIGTNQWLMALRSASG